MPIVRLPADGWRPRPYQQQAWNYLERGGKHAELVWHRRSGKDEIALHHAACSAMQRTANYWHMLPEYSQARKAIWDAVNPHTGKKRIDEAFPHEIRATTRNQEMQIEFKNGSTWQVVGSDSFDRLVGATPAGVVASEWALANPAARAYLRPILMENGGWQVYITTPRGRNHAMRTYQGALKAPGSFAQLLSATQTAVFTPEQLESERQGYIEEYGEAQGIALFEQEYYCSFDAPLLGAYYGQEFRKIKAEKRITVVEYDPAVPVHTAWDLGRTDDTSIWWYQVVAGEIHILESHSSNLKDVPFYIDLIRSKPYKYGLHWLPHDARAKTLASGGKSIEEMLRSALGHGAIRIVPELSLQDGIQAVRALLDRCWFNEATTLHEVDCLQQYQRIWDSNRKCFSDRPLHDWTSHPADAFRMLAIAWREEYKPAAKPKPRFETDLTIAELIKRQGQARRELES